jgi:hypothetical protein
MSKKTSHDLDLEHHDSPEKVDTSVIDYAVHEEHLTESYKATEKRIVRKLDLTLVPMLWVMYLFNYLDRNNIA